MHDGQFREVEPVMTHLTVIGSSLILNSVAPLRERIPTMPPRIVENKMIEAWDWSARAPTRKWSRVRRAPTRGL